MNDTHEEFMPGAHVEVLTKQAEGQTRRIRSSSNITRVSTTDIIQETS